MSQLNLRLDDDLIENLRRIAAQSGGSVSELIRSALRERLDADCCVEFAPMWKDFRSASPKPTKASFQTLISRLLLDDFSRERIATFTARERKIAIEYFLLARDLNQMHQFPKFRLHADGVLEKVE